MRKEGGAQLLVPRAQPLVGAGLKKSNSLAHSLFKGVCLCSAGDSGGAKALRPTGDFTKAATREGKLPWKGPA